MHRIRFRWLFTITDIDNLKFSAYDTVMAYRTQTCEDCTLCCKLLGVVELDKPVNQFCAYCPDGKGGCGRYATRPKTCKDFECGYLTAPLPIEFRPDNVHIIVTGEDKKLRVQFIHVDPDYPNAPNSPHGKSLIGLLRRYGFPDIVMTIGDHLEVISDNPVRAAFLLYELRKAG